MRERLVVFNKTIDRFTYFPRFLTRGINVDHYLRLQLYQQTKNVYFVIAIHFNH